MLVHITLLVQIASTACRTSAATGSGIQELTGFARGIVDEQAPVAAALSLEWSNGQTEGQVNKLKLLKRQMYGRAYFELLRHRFLLSA